MSSPSGRVILVGCGGHARSIADTLLHNAPDTELIFWDDNARPNERILGFPAVQQVEPQEGDRFVLGIGENEERRARFLTMNRDELLTVVSDLARLGRGAEVRCGCFVSHAALIGPEARIGDNTIINTAAVVEHEVVIGAHCHVAPGAVICGRATIGDEVLLGVGSKVLDGVTICSTVVIGAGAVVCADVELPGTYVGCPAKPLEKAG